MWEVNTESIRISSACPGLEVQGWLLYCPGGKPRAILQISHGMCEHSGRYLPFARYMARRGYVVCLHDHLGHGKTSDLPGGVDGWFGPGPGAAWLVGDLRRMGERAKARFPGLPLILLGHSMGSFIARWFAECSPRALDALILSGTGDAPAGIGGALALTSAIAAAKGPQYRPELVQKLAFGPYLDRIPHPLTPYDWISRDEAVVAAYAADPKCTFVFTVSAFRELFWLLRQVSRPGWYEKLPRRLPVRLFSGDADPVGGYGKGVARVYEGLRRTGHRDLKMKLYPGGRHEMLNERGKEQVYADVLNWCEEILRRLPQPPAEKDQRGNKKQDAHRDT